MKSLRLSALAGVLVSTTLFPVVAMGDDTEVFFARAAQSSNRAANVLFMFDISGSMGNTDGIGVRRINRLKQAMVDMLESTEGVNVGIGSFNGRRQGGAILYPATDPNADVCENALCDEINVRAPVRSTNDDAVQKANGTIDLHSSRLEFGYVVDDIAIDEIAITVDPLDDVVQFGTGALFNDFGGVPFFYFPGQPQASIGLRFQNVGIPAGATIVSANVEFRTYANGSSGDRGATIAIDASDDNGSGSPAFVDMDGLRVIDRPRLSSVVQWDDMAWVDSGGQLVETPDITALIEARVNQPDWNSGDALSLLFEAGEGYGPMASNYRAFQSADTGDGAILRIRYTTSAAAAVRVGLRFADLDIPRGATINHAVVEMLPSLTDSIDTELGIRAQAIGHAPAFRDLTGNISSRTLTTAQVDWTVEPWLQTKPEFQTVDLAPIVQEVVNRSDWCGGNALAMVFAGTGNRVAKSRDASHEIYDAPVLKVSYDPATVPTTSTCTRGLASASVRSDMDDAEENATVVTTTGVDLDPMRDGAVSTLGLRFPGLDVPGNAKIASAYLKLVTAATDEVDLTLAVRVEPTPNAAAFDGSVASDVSTRTASATAIQWQVPEAQVGDRITSVDIGPLIESLVATSGWSPGSAIVVTLQRTSGEGIRRFEAFESGQSKAARLDVRYQSEASAAAGEPLVLRTAREDMLDTVLGFRHRSGTPLIDSYYESALYMLGEPVDFGRTRGYQDSAERFFRVSAPSTYTGGTLETPPDCSDVNPNAVACVGEQITGDAVYDAPEAGSCQANQIVLLSDGAATQGDSIDRIQTLTGGGSCVTRDNSKEICGVELADWLYNPQGEVRSPVITHTIGFNFSNDFLRDVATAGGGRFQEASSASDLSGVFRTIINEAADIDTGFVAPAATVSQYNRFTNREDVYFSMFKPSLSARWNGNLKRYRLGAHPDTGEVNFYDTIGASPIINALTGSIRSDARSFWTDGDADGSDVSRGGAANEFALPRKVLTYIENAQTDGTVTRSLVPLHEDTDSIDAVMLGITPGDTTYREELLQWARGVDVLDADNNGDFTEVRHQMGDPMHSTPFVMNYDSDGSTIPESVVFVGTNEGYLHAIDAQEGNEVFGFVPPELLRNLDKFYRDQTGDDRPYGLDGPVGGYFDDQDGDGLVDSDETAIVFVGMRRGGRNYYAIDVSNPLTPQVAWVIKGGAGDFVELGETWSRPIRMTVLDGSNERDVLVFGGGYDRANDTREERSTINLPVGGSLGDVVGTITGQDTMGRAIFMVDAWSGTYITHVAAPGYADMQYAIPSDVNVVDIDLDGLADMIWVGDMGGQLWRFDISGATGTSLAQSISGAAVADFGSIGTRANRRFYYAPDITLVQDDDRAVFMNVGIGSGWRAHPLDDVVEDRFYMLRVDAIYSPPRDADGVLDYPYVVESDLYDVTGGSVHDDTSGNAIKGWYLGFGNDGEKVLGSPVTVNSQVFFTSYVPDAIAGGDDCSVSIGGGRLYAMDAVYGNAVFDLDEEAGESPDDLRIEDRSAPIATPGLPPPVEVFIPKSAPDEVIGSVGATVFETNPGPSLKRTYWAEQ